MDYTEVDFAITPLLPAREVLLYELGELGYESFVETKAGLKAYIPTDQYKANDVNELSILQQDFCEVVYTTNVIPDRNWNEVWESNFEPIIVGDQCIIAAPFHHIEETVPYHILIEPQMSFGTGHHETTHLIVEKLLEDDLTKETVLDMGCGTGVLAILAEMKGSTSIQAIDTDEWAYSNAKDNIARNNCVNIGVDKGGAELLRSNTFSLILANINRNVLLQDMETYVNSLKSPGKIYFSGFFNTDIPVIEQKATSLGLVFADRREKNNWVMLAFTQK
jgi:ribosomal protein L11 methyltransferase